MSRPMINSWTHIWRTFLQFDLGVPQVLAEILHTFSQHNHLGSQEDSLTNIITLIQHYSASILPTIVGNPTISKNPSTCLVFPPKIRLKSQNPTVGNFKKNFPPKSV